MSGRISLSRRAAQALLATLTQRAPMVLCPVPPEVEELRRALAPKKRKPMAVASRNAKATKRADKNEATAVLRLAALERANGRCECGCGGWLQAGSWISAPEMDHAESRRVPQKISNVWILRSACHRARTANRPSREGWLVRWRDHCERHGYVSEAQSAAAKLASLNNIKAAAEVSR